ncbi:spore germination protein [Caloramator sp. mosi_1]|nr:spore germination protein [Caloramator sp. mosi_1]WDC85532.1 spore germination protein [Caloramator sp. mosi_1]
MFVTNLCNRKSIELHIIRPLLNEVKEDIETMQEPAEYLIQNYLSVSEAQIIKHLDNITVELLRGKCLILIDKTNQAILCDTSDIPHRNIQESNVEKTIRGGRECFVENLEINLALIQNKVKSNKLRIERLILGTENNADAAIIYLDGVIDPVVLDSIKFKLNRIKNYPMYYARDM